MRPALTMPGHDKPLSADHCDLCRRYHHDRRYREMADRGFANLAASSIPLVDCVHLGEPLPGQSNCNSCADKLRACDPHGKCTTGKKLDGYACCAGCPDYLTPFVEEFREAVSRMRQIEYPENRFGGRGIVIPAGGWKMLPGVYVTAKMLRWEAVGCKLPIEVWYIGDNGEFDPIFDRITAGLGVTWRDASAELRRLGIERRERLHGWALKPLALLLSSFQEVVMMDADCYPVYDPEILIDDERVKLAGSMFFPDNPQAKYGRPLSPQQWQAFGLRSPANVPGFESGQMIVDKRRAWRAVNVAEWLSDRMDYFDATRGGRIGIHGDKEIFSIAWHATANRFVMAPPVRFHEVAFLQHDFDGEVAFVHRCQDKPRLRVWGASNTTQKFEQQNFRSTTLPHEHMFHHFVDELREVLRPSIPGFRDGTQDEQIWMENRVWNVYRLPERMDGWRVLDVGAHAGFFALECLRRGAELVVCVEPFPANAEALRKNLGLWQGKTRVIEKAICHPGIDKAGVRGSLRGPEFTGEAHVVSPGDGYPVDATSLDLLIDEFGRIDLLKFDCEGCEYPAILTAERLADVPRIVGEWHSLGCAGVPDRLREKMAACGFSVEMTGLSGGLGGFFADRRA